MSLNVTFNGQIYIVPETGEVGWGGNTTSYLVAIAAGCLQNTGGLFTLSAETDFGADFGIASLYYSSRSVNHASAGILRLANNSDAINWRNAANSADLSLLVNGSDLLTFNGSTVYTLGAGTITNADVAAGAGIVYSKLNLTGGIVNADVNAAAAIDYSKLNVPNGAITYSKLTLTDSIVNADINSAAGILFSKMQTIAASSMVVTQAGGIVTGSTWGFLSDHLTTGSENELRFRDSASNYVSLKAANSVTTHGYILPTAQGAVGEVLAVQNAGTGQLQWQAMSGAGTINSGIAGRVTYYPANGITVDDTSAITTDGSTWARFAVGTVAIPGIAFNGDGDTGITQAGVANTLAFVTSGGTRLTIENSVVSTLTPLSVVDGTAASPAIRFASDTNTGIFHTATADRMEVATAGTTRFRFQENGDIVILSSGAHFYAQDGSESTPGISWADDADSGFYRASPNATGYSGNGTQSLLFTSEGIRVANGSLTAPSITFIGDADTGFAWLASGAFSFTSNTTEILRFQNGGLEQKAGVFKGPSGTAAAPFYTFDGDEDLGIYRAAANDIGFAANGIAIADIRVTGSTHQLRVGTAANSGGINGVALQNDSDTANTSAVFSATVGGPNSLDPYIQFNIGGPSRSYSVGIDNSDSDTFKIDSAVSGSTPGANTLMAITSSGLWRATNGGQTSPAISFLSDTNTGLFRRASDQVAITCGGQEIATFATVASGGLVMLNAADINSNRIQPNADNTYTLGTGSARWSEVFAAIGTINTSHSTTKYDIQDLEELEVPRAVRYKVKDDVSHKKGKEYIGYLNDTLPDAARPWNEDGSLVKTANYENAVVGILCNAVRKLQDEIKTLKEKYDGR